MHEAGCRLFSTHWASVRDVYMAGRTRQLTVLRCWRAAISTIHTGPWLSAFWMEVFQILGHGVPDIFRGDADLGIPVLAEAFPLALR